MITLRPLVREDASILAELDGGMTFPQALALLEKPNLEGVMAIAADSAAGFILGWVVEGEGEIIQITVDPAYRRQGIGRTLLKTYLNCYCSSGCRLDVAEDNSAAISLYHQVGFAETGRRRGYYKRQDERVDAILMRLDTPEGDD